MAGGGSTLLLTASAMVAFAANSLLCRLALVDPTIDPASFTAVRLLSGAITLALLVALRGGGANLIAAGSWRSGAALFGYAIAFSFAYVTLGASTGALILFGTVQMTMIGVGLVRGERLGALQWLGLLVAVGGLAYLLAPGLHAPAPLGAALMAGAGVAWGVYSLLGRSAHSQRFEPTTTTAGNFLRAAPMALLVIPFMPAITLSAHGVTLAIASGAIASGLGYAVWYTALKGLRASEAAIVQLTVPVIAAAGAIMFLSEALTFRFALASAAILGGVALVLSARRA
jgi:drug/metabolite transporter (DMT)-like permease